MKSRIPPPLQLRNLSRSLEARVPIKALRDIVNRLRYGANAPLSDECLFVRPNDITRSYAPGDGAPHFRRGDSGRVVGGDWDRRLSPVGSHLKYRACMAHFRDGVPWEETGLWNDLQDRIARHGSFDGLRTLEDIRQRYAALDRLADEVRKTGRLRTRVELGDKYFRREHGGVLAHVTREGEVVRAGGGQHRFALAQALDLDEMPIQLGVIHPAALSTGVLPRLRQRPQHSPGRKKR